MNLSGLNPAQREAVQSISDSNVLVIAGAGTGKCLGYGTRVLLHNGKLRQVQDIQPGDCLMGPDSKPRRVLSVSQGHGELYQVTPVKGDPWVCNEDHILTISGTGRYQGQVIDVSVADLQKRYSNRADKHWKLLRVGVEFRTRKVPVDPYLVGVWLGDGSRGRAELTNSDPEVIAYCNRIAPDYNCKVKADWDPRCNTWRHTFILTDEENSKPGRPVNKLIRFCKSLTDEDGNKFIPLAYRANSREVRLQVLAGLLDTDGYLYESGNGYEITSKFKRLAHNIAYLARSLGLAAYIKPKRATIKERGFEGWYWRISISGDTDMIPCKVDRKQSKPRSQIKNVLHTGFTLDPIGAGDYYGFTLNGDGRFLLGDFTVTHNTRVLTSTAAYLVSGGVSPRNILLLTFTNRAAAEMKERAGQLIGGEVPILATTFHSFGAYMLRGLGKRVGVTSQHNIIDQDDSHSILTHIRKKLFDGQPRDADTLPSTGDIADMISAANAQCKTFEGLLEEKLGIPDGDRKLMLAMQEMYTEHKDRCLQLDFDDLLVKLNEMLRIKDVRTAMRRRFRYVLVDEYQDTNHLQARIFYRLVGKATRSRFMVVGDDAQCIYTWRYARHTNLFEVAERFEGVKVVKLEQNYRSSQVILDLANAFQEQMEQQFQKTLFSETTVGPTPEVLQLPDPFAEARHILHAIQSHRGKGGRLDDIAVLYRTNRCPTHLEIELMRNKVPYRKFGGRNFNEAKHVKDILAHLRIVLNPKDNQAALRTLMLCAKIGPRNAERIMHADRGSLADRIYAYSDDPPPPLTDLRNVLLSISHTKDPVAAVTRVCRYYLNLPSTQAASKNQKSSAARQYRIQSDCDALIGIASSYKSVRALVRDLALNTDSDKSKKKERMVTLSTVHSAKGLEWPIVFVMQAYDGKMPKYGKDGSTDLEEELRIFYVAVTRPKKRLVITQPVTIRFRNDIQHTEPSPFLTQAREDHPQVFKIRKMLDAHFDQRARLRY